MSQVISRVAIYDWIMSPDSISPTALSAIDAQQAQQRHQEVIQFLIKQGPGFLNCCIVDNRLGDVQDFDYNGVQFTIGQVHEALPAARERTLRWASEFNRP